MRSNVGSWETLSVRFGSDPAVPSPRDLPGFHRTARDIGQTTPFVQSASYNAPCLGDFDLRHSSSCPVPGLSTPECIRKSVMLLTFVPGGTS